MVFDRFFSKVSFPRGGTDGCWLWCGAKDRDGYGAFQISSKRTSAAHLVAWALYKGEIEPGCQIDHLCRVRNCVNPNHMEAVTPLVNTLRGVSVSAVNAALVACRRGHPFDATNTYLVNGSRTCRKCKKEGEKTRAQRASFAS